MDPNGLKLDGYRFEVVRNGRMTTLYSRREKVLNQRFPDYPEMPFRQPSRTGRRPVGSGPHCGEDEGMCLGATGGGRRDSVYGMDRSGIIRDTRILSGSETTSNLLK
jgi:hypothetical protein